jgi:predicted HAD superfamily Cof-like phosphohydrolase
MSLLDYINHVREFHDTFLIESRNAPEGKLAENDFMLRYNLMREENEEYLEAARNGNLVEVADALGDQLYILFGTLLKHGLQHKIEEVYLEIHRSNMSKLDENGKPIFREDGKIMKSNRYFKPDISRILNGSEHQNHAENYQD